MQLSKFATEYVIRLASPARGFSPKTTESYDLTFRQFIAYLLNAGMTDDVRNFTPDNVEGFVEYLSKNGISANSINVKLAGLSSLGRHAMRTKDGRGKYLVDVNPVDRVERPQKTRPARKFLHRDELSKLLSVEAPENELLARDLFVDTGLRVSELAKASVEDLRLAGDVVVLSVSVKGRGRSQEKVDIPLGKHVGERLMKHLQEREAGAKDPVLVNREGRRYTRTTLSEMVARMGKRAGIERLNVRPHAIRHTYNVLARQAGLDPTVRAKLLNHTDMNTVQRYDHLLPEETIAARERVRQEVMK